MKKIIALLLSLCMVLSLCACGSTKEETKTEEPAAEAPAEETPAEEAPAEEPVEEPAEMAVAMITDYGDITDQSFNQTTYEACKEYCEANGINFKYYKPASDSDDDRIAMIEMAIDEDFNVVVMPGYAFAPAIKATAEEYPEVTFIALDVSEYDLGYEGAIPANLYSAVYQEELCGYMAGYAAVKLGYEKLGFLGGMAVPAVVRYGFGFVQGADAAAKELDKTVEMNYAYGNQFFGDADITAAMDTWYEAGTQVVFACGGGIYSSAAEAAAKVNGKVIGVDVDQSFNIDAAYGEGMTVTSAMKGLAATVKTLLTAVQSGTFQGGQVATLGLVSENPEENYVQIPMTTQFAEGFTADDYAALVASMFKGEITVDNGIETMPATTNCTVTDLGNLK